MNDSASRVRTAGLRIWTHDCHFRMPRRAVIAFFPVLAYRYPYVFFPTLPFTQGLRKVQAVFRSLEEEIPARGWEEQGSILTFTPC